MKLTDIIKAVATELGTSDLKEINKLLKKETAVKFRITGKAVGHFGFTGHIKSISEEGVKVFMTNKVSLIRLNDIETFQKSKPRVERPVRSAKPPEEVEASRTTKTKPSANKKAKTSFKEAHDDFDEEDDDFDDDDGFADDGFESDEELKPKKLKKSKSKTKGKSGSRFIPAFKK